MPLSLAQSGIGHDLTVSAKDRAIRLLIGYWVLILATAAFVYLATRSPNDGLAGMWLELVTMPASLALAGNGLVGTDAILALVVLGFLQACWPTSRSS